MGEAPLHARRAHACAVHGGGSLGLRRMVHGADTHRPLPPVHAAQVRELGSGAFGTAQLMRDRQSGELVAIKYIPRRDVSAACRHPCNRCCAAALHLPCRLGSAALRCC